MSNALPCTEAHDQPSPQPPGRPDNPTAPPTPERSQPLLLPTRQTKPTVLPGVRTGTTTTMPTAFITGGTAGIGLGFAHHLAADGHDLVLVARDQTRLDRTATELTARHAIKVDTLTADLTTIEGCATAEKHLATYTPDILINNNAGRALRVPYSRNPLADEERMLDLLVRAPLRLTHAALPGMTSRRSGAILNIASVAGLLPAGTFGAAKAWLINFSESVRHDVANTAYASSPSAPASPTPTPHPSTPSRPGSGSPSTKSSTKP
jgi:uncharacterized protein